MNDTLGVIVLIEFYTSLCIMLLTTFWWSEEIRKHARARRELNGLVYRLVKQ